MSVSRPNGAGAAPRAAAAALLALAAVLIPPRAAVPQEAAAVPGPPVPRISLAGAVARALAESREARLADREESAAREGIGRAQAKRLPRVDVSADVTAFSDEPAVLIQGREVPTVEQAVLRARVVADQTIADFGKTGSQVDRSRARAEAVSGEAGASRERLAFEAAAAFLEARRAEALREVAAEALATARAHRAVAGDLYDGGVVARHDVLAADVVAANAEAALVAAENRVALSHARLALRAGLPGDEALAPEPGPFTAPDGPLPPLGESLGAARRKRAEVRAGEALVREGEALAASTSSEFAPAFFARGEYGYDSNAYNARTNLFSVLLGGRMNLFAGGGDEAARREARLGVARRQESLALIRDEIALEVREAHLAAEEAAKRRSVAEVAVARSEENLRIQEERYREGIAIATEVQDAQVLRTRAKADLQNAGYDHVEARFRLLRARGELLDFFAPPLPPSRPAPAP